MSCKTKLNIGIPLVIYFTVYRTHKHTRFKVYEIISFKCLVCKHYTVSSYSMLRRKPSKWKTHGKHNGIAGHVNYELPDVWGRKFSRFTDYLSWIKLAEQSGRIEIYNCTISVPIYNKFQVGEHSLMWASLKLKFPLRRCSKFGNFSHKAANNVKNSDQILVDINVLRLQTNRKPE